MRSHEAMCTPQLTPAMLLTLLRRVPQYTTAAG